MKTKTTFDTGNFSLNVEGTFSDDAMKDALEAALKYILQRDVATRAYTALAGEANAKGELRLDPKFVRKSVPFTPDGALTFKSASIVALNKLGEFTVEVTEYIPGESGAEMVMATNFVAQVRQKDEAGQRRSLAAFDAEPEMDDADIVKLVHAGLAGLRKPKEKKST